MKGFSFVQAHSRNAPPPLPPHSPEQQAGALVHAQKQHAVEPLAADNSDILLKTAAHVPIILPPQQLPWQLLWTADSTRIHAMRSKQQFRLAKILYTTRHWRLGGDCWCVEQQQHQL